MVAGMLVIARPVSAQRGPAPTATHISPDVLAMACAPSVTDEPVVASLRVTGGQESFPRQTFSQGDLITINGGSENGIEVGQEYFVRRVQIERSQPISIATPAGIRTAGWIRVYAVDTALSLATVVYGCDTINVGDYLEPFVMPTVPAPSTENIKPQRSNYGRIMFGTDRRQSFAKSDFFIVNRGSDHGVIVGARFIVYRDKRQAQNFLYDLGEAVAVEVRPESSTLQAILSRDEFHAGDYVALRK
jgi:hypothetical protein